MSMLAEPRRKQKWSLNPRGKDWAQDSNKFGQKMLEKMGWSSGKGLGAKENGITEHVKVSYKNDSKGMGYKENSEQWTEHETNFSALLENLCGQRVEEVKVSSLEEKSQKSRARVHYKKFTRGKDLSRYSEKDLANIFGKKSLKELKKPKETIQEPESDKKIDENGSFLFNGGLMSDYFKKKVPNFGNANGYVVGNNGVLQKQDSESEGELKPSFGLGFKENHHTNQKEPTFVSYVNGNDENTPKKKKDKKRKFKDDKMDEETPKKKKKKMAEGLNNPAFDPLFSTPVTVETHPLDPIKEILDDTAVQEPEHFEVNVQVHDEEKKISKKEAGKKKKKQDFDVIEVLEIDDEDESSIAEKLGDSSAESVEIKSERKKKKKKRKGIDNPVIDLTDEKEGELEALENPFEVTVKGKKKKKKKKHLVEQVNDYGLDNPVFNEELSTNEVQVGEEYEVKRKKSKKEQGLDNPALNLSDSVEESCDLMLNVASTPIVETRTHTPSIGSIDRQKLNSVTRRKSVRFSDVTRERIIPTKEQIKLMEDDSVDIEDQSFDMEGRLNDSSEASPSVFRIKKKKKNKQGLENHAFSQQTIDLEENLTSISNQLERFQAEVENDINEAKIKSVELSDIMIGEVGNPHGQNERLPDGSVKLKFRNVKFGKNARYLEGLVGPKKPYKHLIKGDIVLDFKESNLHEIEGYADKHDS